MSMRAKCPKCGGGITVTEEMFGQTASCPGCGAKIRVPARPGGAPGEGSSPPGGAAPAVAAPAGAPAPAQGPPPMPQGPPPLPAHGAAAGGPPEMPQVDPSAGPFVDTGPGAGSVAGRVRGRRTPLNPKIVVGAIAAVGGLVLIGVGLALVMGGGDAPDAIRYMPADAQMIASVDFAGLIDSDIYERLAGENPQMAGFRDEMLRETGLAPEDVRRILVGGSGPDNMIGVAELSKSIDVAAFVQKQGGRAKEEKVGEATIHVSGSDAFHFPTDRTFVFGKASKLREILNPQRTAGLSPKMEEMVGDLDFGRTIAVAFAIAPGSGLTNNIPMAGGIEQLKSVEAGTFYADVGSDLRLEAMLYCKDSETAANLKEMADGMLAMFKQSPDMTPEAQELIDSLSISVSGNRIRARVTISEDLIDQASKEMPSSMRF